MLASATPDLHEPQMTDLPHATCNAGARVADAFLRFAQTVIADNLHARQHGLKIVDAYVNPDGREGDGSAKVKTFPTDLIVPTVFEAVERVKVLARLAARASADDQPTIERAMRASMAKLASLDSELWSAWVASEKAHMSGPDAAILEIDGFAWSSSRKGHSTVIRNDDSAQGYTRQHKASHAYLSTDGYVSEDDMIDALTESW